MLCVPTEVRPSKIHGLGVFLLAPLKKGDLIWRFDTRVDRIYSAADFDALPGLFKNYIDNYIVWDKVNNFYMMCGDQAYFINHADNPTNLSLGVLGDDVAVRDLAAETELTSDYREICDWSKDMGTP